VLVDLHTHTTASDGAATPDELVALAAAARLAAVAVTDHDTVAGVAAAQAAGATLGIKVIAGVELSAVTDDGREVHILGLHLTAPERLAAPLARFQADRCARIETIVAALNRAGVPLTVAAVLEHTGSAAMGRPHVARALVAGGWAHDHRQAFSRWLAEGRPAYVEKPYLSVEAAITLIHTAGGVAMWAHPGRAGTRDRVTAMVMRGLDGIEVSHPGHERAQASRLNAMAEGLKLLRCGGSDWHGARAPSRTLGSMLVPCQWEEAQVRHAAQYR
jgi:predicted metal-dependent phosphoesterase TrpH